MAALRKKHSEGIAEITDQLDTIQKMRAKLEKDKVQQQREIEELHSAIDSESKQRQNVERLAKQLEVQLTDMTLKSDEQARTIQELTMYRNKLQGENSELNRRVVQDMVVFHSLPGELQQLEDAESQLAAVSRIKQQLHAQGEE
ncbi:hypothetical protein ANCDUO_21034, partial [Ancylostoma duodenale]